MDTLWTVNDESIRVEIPPSSTGETWSARVNGKAVEIRSIRAGRMILADGRVFEYASHWSQARKEAVFNHAGENLVVARVDRARLGEQAGATGAVKAPMNGQVSKLLKVVGAPVEAGEVVLVLEAMKMENEVSAPAAGRLKTVDVSVGQSVTPGQKLFEVEDAPDH